MSDDVSPFPWSLPPLGPRSSLFPFVATAVATAEVANVLLILIAPGARFVSLILILLSLTPVHRPTVLLRLEAVLSSAGEFLNAASAPAAAVVVD